MKFKKNWVYTPEKRIILMFWEKRKNSHQVFSLD